MCVQEWISFFFSFFVNITALTACLQFSTICCLSTVGQHQIPSKWYISCSYNSTQLLNCLKKKKKREQHVQNKGNLTHSQSTLNTFYMIHIPSVWLKPSVNIEWLGWGLEWAQWAIWHFEEALSLKPHRAVFWLFYVITDTVLPLSAIHYHCVYVH